MNAFRIIAGIHTKLLSFWPNRVGRRRTRSRGSFAHRSLDVLEPRLLLTFDLQLDYTYDSNGFFNDASRREVLEVAAEVFESRITDDLTAITPNGLDNWIATFNHPGTGAELRVSNLSIPADTLVIYVGARQLNGELARGGPGGFTSNATTAFNQNLRSRGEPGIDEIAATNSDVAPWGGTLTVDTSANWNFSLDQPAVGQNDLYTVAIHELAHVLGFGTSASFANLRSNGRFVGSAATEVFGSSVPLHPDQFHFASNTSSTIPGTQTIQESILDPQITTGTRKSMTDLDWAALDDIGWDVSAPPAAIDFGDAPDAVNGASTLNYNTRLADDGPRHVVTPSLFIGSAAPDGDDGMTVGAVGSSVVNTDDTTGLDDEGFTGSDLLAMVTDSSTSINVNVTNTTQHSATLHGWIDGNLNGQFEISERASAFVDAGTVNGIVTLNFSNVADRSLENRTTSYARFRLSTDSAAAMPTGLASDGEIEDHSIQIYPPSIAYDSLPSFRWPAVVQAERYEVQVDNVNSGVTAVLVDSHIFPTGVSSADSTISFRPAVAFLAGAYQWRYRAFVDGQFGAFSSPSSFQIFEKSIQPAITDPVGASADSLPTIAWSPVIGATRYDLWVNGEAQQRIIHQSALSKNSFTPQSSLPAGDYTAWVRAYSGTTPTGGWSAPFRFSVESGPLATTGQITDPAAGTTTNTTPTIGWRPTQGSSHRVQVRNLDSNSIVADVDNVTGSHLTLTEALPPGNYAATVTVNGLNGNIPAVDFISPTFHVAAVTGQAQMTSPVGDAEDPLPVFSWTSVTGANRYELWVDDVTNRTSRIIHDAQLTTTSLATKTPLSPGVYRAWIRAFDGNTTIGTWSRSISFRVTQAPEIPTIWSPLNTVSSSNRTVAWSSVVGASGYTLKIHAVNSDQGFDEVVSETGLITNSFTLPNALTSGTYRATATAASPHGSVSNVKTFVVEAASESVQVISPQGVIADDRPEFSWSAVTSANRYVLWVNDDTRSNVGVILERNVSGTRFTSTESLLPGNYRVWVRAYNGDTAVSAWSETRRFTIQSFNPTTLVTPARGASVVASQVVFRWTAAAVGSTYELWVNRIDTNTPRIYHERNLSALTFTPATTPAVGNYRAWVRAIDANGNVGQWSSAVDFQVVSG